MTQKLNHITKLHQNDYETIIEEYWLELKSYLFGTQVESDLLNDAYYTVNTLEIKNRFLQRFSLNRMSGVQGSRSENLEYIRTNFERYQTVFKTLASTEILLRFVYLASLASLDSEPPLAVNQSELRALTGLEDLDKIIVLARKDGIFTTTEYLEALFDGYFLVGMPITITNFDRRTGTPIVFIDHDCNHIKEMLEKGTPEMFGKHKIIYQSMLKDHTLQKVLQRLFIDIFFSLLHEETNFLFSASSASPNPELLSDFDVAFMDSLCHRPNGFNVSPITVDDSKINQIFEKYHFVDTANDLRENERGLIFGKILLTEYIMG